MIRRVVLIVSPIEASRFQPLHSKLREQGTVTYAFQYAPFTPFLSITRRHAAMTLGKLIDGITQRSDKHIPLDIVAEATGAIILGDLLKTSELPGRRVRTIVVCGTRAEAQYLGTVVSSGRLNIDLRVIGARPKRSIIRTMASGAATVLALYPAPRKLTFMGHRTVKASLRSDWRRVGLLIYNQVGVVPPESAPSIATELEKLENAELPREQQRQLHLLVEGLRELLRIPDISSADLATA